MTKMNNDQRAERVKRSCLALLVNPDELGRMAVIAGPEARFCQAKICKLLKKLYEFSQRFGIKLLFLGIWQEMFNYFEPLNANYVLVVLTYN